MAKAKPYKTWLFFFSISHKEELKTCKKKQRFQVHPTNLICQGQKRNCQACGTKKKSNSEQANGNGFVLPICKTYNVKVKVKKQGKY